MMELKQKEYTVEQFETAFTYKELCKVLEFPGYKDIEHTDVTKNCIYRFNGTCNTCSNCNGVPCAIITHNTGVFIRKEQPDNFDQLYDILVDYESGEITINEAIDLISGADESNEHRYKDALLKIKAIKCSGNHPTTYLSVINDLVIEALKLKI